MDPAIDDVRIWLIASIRSMDRRAGEAGHPGRPG
jgi:hypothetical protein